MLKLQKGDMKEAFWHLIGWYWTASEMGIRAKHIKAWLHGAKKVEDPETAVYHVGAGMTWYMFVSLCSSIWAMGTIPQQMCWVVTVLIPKGGRVVGYWATRTDLEGFREGHRPQTGGNCLAQ